MNTIEKFRDAVTNAIITATAAGAEERHLHAVLLDLAGLNRAAAHEAANDLDRLIDGEQDELAEQLAPARNILKRIAGN